MRPLIIEASINRVMLAPGVSSLMSQLSSCLSCRRKLSGLVWVAFRSGGTRMHLPGWVLGQSHRALCREGTCVLFNGLLSLVLKFFMIFSKGPAFSFCTSS